MEVTVPDELVFSDFVAGEMLAFYGEGVAIEYMEGAVLNSCDGSIDCFLSAFCASGAEGADKNCIVGIAMAPILLHFFAVQSCADSIGVVCTPVILGGGESNIGSDAQHVHIVTDNVNIGIIGIVCSLYSGGSTGGVSMLGDDDAAESHQSVCSLCFEGEVKPLVGVLNVHICFGNDGADAEEECGITGNNLCIGICAYITDMGIVNEAVIHELLELETCNDAGNIASFIDVGEIIEDIVEISLLGSGLAGCMAEENVGIFLCSLDEIALMVEGICKDDIAALLCEIDCGLIAFLIFGNIVLIDDLVFPKTVCLPCCLYAFHMSSGIAFVFVSNENDADFEIVILGAACAEAAGCHNERECECDELLHYCYFPLCFLIANSYDSNIIASVFAISMPYSTL